MGQFLKFPKKLKFKNKKSESLVYGHRFDSRLELSLFNHLMLRQKSGEIKDLKCKPNVHLTRAKILMIPDFCFVKDGIQVFAEAKGFQTAEYRIKRKLWFYYGPGPLEVWMGKYNSIFLHEIVTPKIENS